MDSRRFPEGSDRLVVVFSTASTSEGWLAKGLLESRGIAATLKGEGEGPYRTGPMYVWVPAAFEVEARRILEEAVSR